MVFNTSSIYFTLISRNKCNYWHSLRTFAAVGFITKKKYTLERWMANLFCFFFFSFQKQKWGLRLNSPFNREHNSNHIETVQIYYYLALEIASWYSIKWYRSRLPANSCAIWIDGVSVEKKYSYLIGLQSFQWYILNYLSLLF